MKMEGIHNKEESSFYFGRMENREEKIKEAGESVKGSDLNLAQDDVVTKKIQARKDSIKMMLETFTSQLKIDQDMETRSNHIDELREELRNSQEEISRIKEQKEKIRAEFGIDKESQEYKDFQLLEKSENLKKMGKSSLLSEEEKERLKTMGPMTEFQKEALKLNDMESFWKKKSTEAENGIIREVGILKGIKQELLKSNPMLETVKEVEKLIERTGEEIIGLLLDEAKDHVDGEMEKEEEKEEKIKEKKEKEEEIKEKQEEKEAKEAGQAGTDTVEMDDIKQLQKAGINQKKIEDEIRLILAGQKIGTEDLKGIKVDESL